LPQGIRHTISCPEPTWKLGAVSISILRKQFDKTYVAVAFNNNSARFTLNFIVVNGPGGWSFRCREPAMIHCACSRAIQKTHIVYSRLAQARECPASARADSGCGGFIRTSVGIRSLKDGAAPADSSGDWRVQLRDRRHLDFGRRRRCRRRGLNCDAPGGRICAEAHNRTSAAITAATKIDKRFHGNMS